MTAVTVPGPARNDTFLYLDTSALVKLVIAEAESSALRTFLATWPLWVSSILAQVELIRAVRRSSVPGAVAAAEQILGFIDFIPLDRHILQAAGSVNPMGLRSLDAIHLASAWGLGRDLGALVTYDERLAEAARATGMAVYAPR